MLDIGVAASLAAAIVSFVCASGSGNQSLTQKGPMFFIQERVGFNNAASA